MIYRVQVKNYRSLADVDVTLGPLTVLVGRNGAGKSSFVDVLRFTRDAVGRGIDYALMERQGVGALRRWMPRSNPDIEISIQAATINLFGEYSFAIKTKAEGQYAVRRESCRTGIASTQIDSEFSTKNGVWEMPPRGEFSDLGNRTIDEDALLLPGLSVFSRKMAWLHRSLARSCFYAIFPNQLREPQNQQPGEILSEDGSNLASVLRRIVKNRSYLPDFIAALDRIVGGVSDVQVQQVGGYLVTQLQHQFANKKSCWFDLAQESDGTLRILALLVALHPEPSPFLMGNLIGIEEPELTLHPGALGVLSDVLREASKRGQILITTQSPDLISRFSTDELRIVEMVDGVTHIGPLEETQREVIHRQLFSAGDLLRIEGLHRAPIPVGDGDHA